MSEMDTHDAALFDFLVTRFETEGWLLLGKIANPATGNAERHLDAAKVVIDLLGMLERKTEGHRSEEESRRLRGALTTLRLNYVEELARPDAGSAAGGTGEGDAAHDAPTQEN
jgi:hypothetical protein